MAICDDFHGPPTAGEAAVYTKVVELAESISHHHRPRKAVCVTPEGIHAVERGWLSERLRSAGLDREAREAFTRARGDFEQLLVWCEGEDENGAAVARFGTLKSPVAKQRRRNGHA
jgi:hypothetical protein